MQSKRSKQTIQGKDVFGPKEYSFMLKYNWGPEAQLFSNKSRIRVSKLKSKRHWYPYTLNIYYYSDRTYEKNECFLIVLSLAHSNLM